MRSLKIALGYYFIIFSLIYLQGAYWVLKDMSCSQDKVTLIVSVLMVTVCSITGTTLGIAWWSSWREWSSTRGWAIAASLLNLGVLIGFALFIYHVDGLGQFCYVERYLWIPQTIGVIVLIVFSISSTTGCPKDDPTVK